MTTSTLSFASNIPNMFPAADVSRPFCPVQLEAYAREVPRCRRRQAARSRKARANCFRPARTPLLKRRHFQGRWYVIESPLMSSCVMFPPQCQDLARTSSSPSAARASSFSRSRHLVTRDRCSFIHANYDSAADFASLSQHCSEIEQQMYVERAAAWCAPPHRTLQVRRQPCAGKQAVLFRPSTHCLRRVGIQH